MTDKWIKDTGLVFALIFLVIGFNSKREFIVISAIFLVITVLAPKILYPLAYIWLKLVEVLGLIVPKIFFSLVFFIVIFPIGIIRRLIKGDISMISGWRDVESSFKSRNHLYIKEDFEVPY